jgi:integron integrase
MELKNYSFLTQKNYRWWIKKYIIFHQKKHPINMGKKEVELFLKHLQNEKNLSPTSQNQALNAIIFLYEDVLETPIKNQNLKTLRIKREDNKPVILTKEELTQLFYYMNGVYKLMATLMYGCGLRMSELINLKIQDINFKLNEVYVDERVIPLPQKIVEDLGIHVKEVKRVYGDDLNQGYGYIYEGNKNIEEQFLFPMKKVVLDENSNKMTRLSITDKTFGRNVKDASLKANLNKKVSANTLRHSYATHMIQNGLDVKTLQKLLGHKESATTMLYVHIVRELNKKNLSSPLDF